MKPAASTTVGDLKGNSVHMSTKSCRWTRGSYANDVDSRRDGWPLTQYQPPTAARPYWEAMAKRMKLVFKAPIADEDIPLIAEYLAKTYGNEQPK